MTDTKPVRACEHCAFTVIIRPDPKVLQTALICKRLPPTPMAFPNGRGGVNITSMFPVVPPTESCGEWTAREDGPVPMPGDSGQADG